MIIKKHKPKEKEKKMHLYRVLID